MEVARIERFAVLASSIACRQLTVRMTDTHVMHTDGRTIYSLRDHSGRRSTPSVSYNIGHTVAK